MHNFTKNDLLLYVLNETSSETKRLINKALQTDASVRAEFDALKTTVNEIELFEIQPDPKIIDFILQDLFVEESHTASV